MERVWFAFSHLIFLIDHWCQSTSFIASLVIFYICTLVSIVVAHFVYWIVTWLSFILDFLRLIVLIFHLLTVHLWLCFWWYIFIITFWGYFRRVVFSTFFNCLIFAYLVISKVFRSFALLVHFVYLLLLIYITYFVIFVSIAQYFAQSEQQWTYTSQRKYRWETDKVERVFVKLAMLENVFGETCLEKQPK